MDDAQVIQLRTGISADDRPASPSRSRQRGSRRPVASSDPIVGKQDVPEPPRVRQSPPARQMSGWERSVAGGLAFLRRRISGDYEIDDFGFDVGSHR